MLRAARHTAHDNAWRWSPPITAVPMTANDSYGWPWECVYPRRGASEKGDTAWNVCFGSAAGAIGTGARYLIALWAAQRFGSAFPHGTLIVNLIGCFAIAALMHAALTLGWPPTVRAAATIGFIGGLDHLLELRSPVRYHSPPLRAWAPRERELPKAAHQSRNRTSRTNTEEYRGRRL